MIRLLWILLLAPIVVSAQQFSISAPEAPEPAKMLTQAVNQQLASINIAVAQGSSSQPTNTTPITRNEAEERALKNNPRITAPTH